ncbi:MAG: YdcF family protein [Clostridiales Family XIII bacterium]|nr:YdcF family protein [Clostridiales Family XIII bacterium]
MKIGIILIALAVVFIAAINFYIIFDTQGKLPNSTNYILSVDEAAKLGEEEEPPECILVLGASVQDGEPSQMLADRLDTALEVYQRGGSKIFLLSGDNGTVEYNEVLSMQNYILEHGAEYNVDPDDIFLDHAGFSTYESLYRMKEIFGVKKALVVTQEYHLYRAVYDGRRLGMDVYGVIVPPTKNGQWKRSVREIFARTKDFCWATIGKKPKFLGDPIELK